MRVGNIAEFDVVFQVHGLMLAGLAADEKGLKYALEHAPYPRAEAEDER